MTGLRLGSTLTDLIGNTPVTRLSAVVPDGSADVYVKLEWFNPTGSYKDRMAAAIVEEAEKRGDLRPGMTVVEYTGGSTGSSLAFVCAIKGYRFVAVSSDAFAPEKLRTMKAFGAELVIVPSEGGVITPDLTPRMIDKARELAAEPGTFWSDQFRNYDAVIGYRRAGEELLEQVPKPIDAVCLAVGTAGFAMGIATALRAAGSGARVVLLEPATSAVLSGSEAGAHHVEGIGVGFRPPLLDDDYFDEIRPIEEGVGRAMARRLSREEGLLTGVSSGLHVAAALDLAAELGSGKTVATVAVDTGLKYLAGDLFDI
jgi:cysteine synthase A